MFPKTIQYVEAVPARAATGVVRDVFRQAKAEMGLLPEAVTMWSADPRLLTAAWGPFREALLATGAAPRPVKEAVAATVSTLNECPYCVDAHTIMLYGSGGAGFASGLLGLDPSASAEPELAAAADWARSVMVRPQAPVAAPFPSAAVPEVLGTFAHFQFLNRAIDVLLDGTFLPGSPNAHKVARKIAGKVMARTIRSEKVPGAAVGLGPGILPDDLSWALPNMAVASAFAGLAQATDAARDRAVPPAAAALVEHVLDGWDGRFPGPSRAWLDEATAPLGAGEVAAGRLALLTAMAPFQATAEDVTAYRADRPGGEDLLGLVAWSAFAAARRMAGWAVPAAVRTG
jgi:AhpD family alkylhydroperoxidase